MRELHPNANNLDELISQFEKWQENSRAYFTNDDRERKTKRRIRWFQAHFQSHPSSWPADLAWLYIANLVSLANFYLVTHKKFAAQFLLEHAVGIMKCLEEKHRYTFVAMAVAEGFMGVGLYRMARELYEAVLELVESHLDVENAPSADETKLAIGRSIHEQELWSEFAKRYQHEEGGEHE